MQNIILECADKHCPTRRMKIRDNSPSWMQREIIEELYLKDDLYKTARLSGNEGDWKIFRDQNKFVKNLILESKEEYVKEILEQNQGNPRQFWRKINEISGLHKKKKKQGIDQILGENEEELQDMDGAEYMNSYYTEAGPKLAKKINSEWEASDNLKNHTCTFEFEFIPEQWVKRLISEIKICKSSAVDNLSSRILKDAFQVSTVELTYIYIIYVSQVEFSRRVGVLAK